MEAFDGYNVLIMHGMTFEPTTMDVTVPELDIVLGKAFLITNHDGSMPEILRERFKIGQGKAGVSAILFVQIACIVGALIGGFMSA